LLIAFVGLFDANPKMPLFLVPVCGPFFGSVG
jgi:hypothetical protein